jgi:hypothetical protein
LLEDCQKGSGEVLRSKLHVVIQELTRTADYSSQMEVNCAFNLLLSGALLEGRAVAGFLA